MPRTRPSTTPNSPDADQADPDQVERRARPVDSDSFHQASGISTMPDRHVQPEDVLPRPSGGDGPADQGPMATAAPPMAPQMPEGGIAPLGGDRRTEQGQRQRHDHRPAGPWTARAATRTPMLGASAATADAAGEQGDAEDEDPPATEPLTDSGRREQEDGEGQGVGVDRPLQAGQAGVEVDPDDRERGRDHQVVESGHEQGHPGDHDGPHGPRSGPGGGRSACLRPRGRRRSAGTGRWRRPLGRGGR